MVFIPKDNALTSDGLNLPDRIGWKSRIGPELDAVHEGVAVLQEGPGDLGPVGAAVLVSVVSQQPLCGLHDSFGSEIAVCVLCRADLVIVSAPGLEEVLEPGGDKLTSTRWWG